MNNILYSMIGVMIPFIGTSLGSSFVFFLKKIMNEKVQKIIVGFAAGVMIAASVWSLILPAVEMAEAQGIIAWIPPTIGFMVGVVFLIVTNYIAERIENKNNGKKLNMLLFSVTLHNIPEGMAVGVCFAGFLAGNTGTLKMEGESKSRAFIYGVLSGIVEPISALITMLLLNIVVPLLPYLLSSAAGAMIYVVIEELIPEIHSGNRSNLGVIGFTLGFIVMMILDIALG